MSVDEWRVTWEGWHTLLYHERCSFDLSKSRCKVSKYHCCVIPHVSCLTSRGCNICYCGKKDCHGEERCFCTIPVFWSQKGKLYSELMKICERCETFEGVYKRQKKKVFENSGTKTIPKYFNLLRPSDRICGCRCVDISVSQTHDTALFTALTYQPHSETLLTSFFGDVTTLHTFQCRKQWSNEK